MRWTPIADFLKVFRHLKQLHNLKTGAGLIIQNYFSQHVNKLQFLLLLVCRSSAVCNLLDFASFTTSTNNSSRSLCTKALKIWNLSSANPFAQLWSKFKPWRIPVCYTKHPGLLRAVWWVDSGWQLSLYTKMLCVINTAWVTSLIHNAIQSAMRKINFIWTRLCTGRYYNKGPWG